MVTVKYCSEILVRSSNPIHHKASEKKVAKNKVVKKFSENETKSGRAFEAHTITHPKLCNIKLAYGRMIHFLFKSLVHDMPLSSVKSSQIH